MASPSRTYPLRQPPNHEPPVPRWQLVLPEKVTRIFTAYIGIQALPLAPAAAPGAEVDVGINLKKQAALQKASDKIIAWLRTPSHHAPQSVETFRVEQGDDVEGSPVWVCYWDDETRGKQALRELDLWSLYRYLLSQEEQQVIGLWSESFSTLTARLETNYSGGDYRPGVAGLPGGRTEGHRMTGYWGAARDRIPAAGEDAFEGDSADGIDSMNSVDIVSIHGDSSRRILATNPDNMVHIRSGQFWHACDAPERDAYEHALQPRLLAALESLRDNRRASGAVGVRYLRNQDGHEHGLGLGLGLGCVDPHHYLSSDPAQQASRGETSVAAFFRSLRHLEDWASQHPLHLAIYAGAMRHARRFGEARRLRTWHEVSVLKAGEATFEYIHCMPGTGVFGQ
ncbi:hypothetical protein E4U55_000175 [Claviceps digitariae]|nr:hypothetical protein E4U55_000175 [Claviceps digitariae]